MQIRAMLFVGLFGAIAFAPDAARADFVYAAVQFDGSNEVVMYTPSLQGVGNVSINGSILGLTAGVNNDFYISTTRQEARHGGIGRVGRMK